ncbi:hypothetical protein [Paenibacillus lactis]|uniref:hypothetical protein n=1 Tax=Paenibacillus lactis TaxID=228574 RepID=UPI003D705F9D
MKHLVHYGGKIAMILSFALSAGCSISTGEANQRNHPSVSEEAPTPNIGESADLTTQTESEGEEFNRTGELYGSNVMYAIKMYLEKPEVPQESRDKLAESIALGYDWYRKKDVSDFEALARHIKSDNREEVKVIYEKLITIYPLPTKIIKGASFKKAKEPACKIERRSPESGL